MSEAVLASWTALERLRGLLAARELFDAELRDAVRAARAEGADVFLLARLLGVDRSTVYRRYLAVGGGGSAAGS